MLASRLGARLWLTDPPRFVEADLGCLLILALNRFVHFASVHRNLTRRLDSKSDFVATNVDNGHDDVVTNDDAFVALSRKHKHDCAPR
jgi:hypothetical protein